MTSQSTFFKEINREINSVNKELKDIEIQIELVKKDPNHYLDNLYASKKFYQLLVDKFQTALKKAKLEAIRDGKTYPPNGCRADVTVLASSGGGCGCGEGVILKTFSILSTARELAMNRLPWSRTACLHCVLFLILRR